MRPAEMEEMDMRLATKGFKAQDHSIDLQLLNLISGPNGSGKTSIADAVRFLALGYVPALGKRPVDAAALLGNGSMSVELSFDNGRTVKRSLDRNDRGYTLGAEASWLRNTKPTETSKAILGLFGDEEQDVAECLDIRELLSATPNQRAARIEQLLAASARAPEETTKDVARLTVMRLAETTEDRMPKDYRDALPMIPERQVQVLKDTAAMLKAKIVEAQIQGALTWANEEKRAADKALRQKEQAEKELKDRAGQVPQPNDAEISRLEKGKAELLGELGAIRQRLTDYSSKSGAAKQVAEAIAQVQELAKRVDQVAADAKAVHEPAIAELTKKGQQLLDQLSALKPPAEESDAKIRELEAEGDDLDLKALSIEVPGLPGLEDLEVKVQTAEKALAMAEGSDWAEVLEIADELDNARHPAQGASNIAKRLRALAKKGLGGADPQQLKQDLAKARKKLTAGLKEQEEVRLQIAGAQAKIDDLRIDAQKKRRDAQNLREEISDRRKKTSEKLEAKRQQLLAEHRTAETQLATHRSSLEKAASEKAAIDRRLASLQDQALGAGELPAQPPSAEATEKGLATITESLEKLVKARAIHTELHAILTAIENARAGREVFSAIEWALQRQREIEISQAGGPLLRTMTDFLHAAGRREEPFIRAGAGSCAIGWKTTDGKEVQVQVLSGGEWVLFAAALTSSVVLHRKSTVKILLVEAGETDQVTLGQLLKGIQGIEVNGHLTAIVMVQRPLVESIDPAWNVIQLEGVRETAKV